MKIVSLGYFKKFFDKFMFKEIIMLVVLFRVLSFYDFIKNLEFLFFRVNDILRWLYFLGWIFFNEFKFVFNEVLIVYN